MTEGNVRRETGSGRVDVHISEGILPTAVWAGGHALSSSAVALSLRSFDEREIPRVGVLTSVFFVASLIHVPLVAGSVHFQLTALLGIVLGRLCWPAVLVALFLQAVLFLHGALTSLGVNTLIMGVGATVSYLVFRRLGGRSPTNRDAAVAAFVAAIAGFLASSTVYFGAMWQGGDELGELAKYILVVNSPVALVEALITAATVSFIVRVQPELLASAGRTSA